MNTINALSRNRAPLQSDLARCLKLGVVSRRANPELVCIFGHDPSPIIYRGHAHSTGVAWKHSFRNTLGYSLSTRWSSAR